MDYKRITLLCGHYGSGKTNVAVNMSFDLKKQYDYAVIADLDIINPHFRTKDSKQELEQAGIRLICSEYAGSNLDIPAMPQQMYAVTDDKSIKAILDVGGDDRGALALGRLAPAILAEKNYNMLMVINCFRPLTQDAKSTIEVMREIEQACGIAFTGLINNSNLGGETAVEHVLSSVAYAQAISKLTKLPVVCTTVVQPIYDELKGKIEHLFPLKLQPKINQKGE